MKKNVITLVVALLASTSVFAQKWALDKSHAKLNFTVTHLMISDVEGSFKSFDVNLTSSKPDFSDAVIEMTADVSSVNTDNEKRDEHLKSADFFDAAKYSNLSFKSKSFKKVGDKNYKLTGDLTMRGVTKTVTLDVIFNGTAVHPYTKKQVAGFKITGKLNRKDFGIGKDTPSGVVSDEVMIEANAEFIKE